MYVNILTEENLSSIKLAHMGLIYRSVRLSSKRGGDWVKMVDKWHRYVCQLRVLLYYNK